MDRMLLKLFLIGFNKGSLEREWGWGVTGCSPWRLTPCFTIQVDFADLFALIWASSLRSAVAPSLWILMSIPSDIFFAAQQQWRSTRLPVWQWFVVLLSFTVDSFRFFGHRDERPEVAAVAIDFCGDVHLRSNQEIRRPFLSRVGSS